MLSSNASAGRFGFDFEAQALSEVRASFAPWLTWLQQSLEAESKRELRVSVQHVTPDEAKLFTTRLARNRLKGVWVRLCPKAAAKVDELQLWDSALGSRRLYRSAILSHEYAIEIRGVDTEAKALLLAPSPYLQEMKTGTFPLWLSPNTYNLKCQIEALEALLKRPTQAQLPLLRLGLSGVTWRPPSAQPAPVTWHLLKSSEADSPEAKAHTREQQAFVQCALESPDFSLLDGPPGSGKTRSLCELILQMVLQGKRVMVVASTHVAVDNILARLLDWREQAPERKGQLLAVRLGDEARVSPKVHEALLSHQLELWKDAVKQQSSEAPQSQAQRYLKEALDSEGVAHFLLDMANVVCGTTMGILQHPDIKGSRRGSGLDAFDMLIVDEASKTTLTEFLVPARHARRWVLAGDIRQLSPFLGGVSVLPVLQDLVPKPLRQAALWAFQASLSNSPLRSLLALTPQERADLLVEAKARQVPYVDLDLIPEGDESQTHLGLLYANLISGSPETLARYDARLPADLFGENQALPALPRWRAARAALQRQKQVMSRWKVQPEAQEWEAEIAWRLVRLHELRFAASQERRHLEQELRSLVPYRLSDDTRAQVFERLTRLRETCMPSILEVLQEGAREDKAQLAFGAPVLARGLGEALHSRLRRLSYQCRMHCDISRLPRQHFYALSEGESLLKDNRRPSDWPFRHPSQPRAYWLDVPPPRQVTSRVNTSTAEADAVMALLKERHKAALAHPKRTWTVAILTFYRAQEELLRTRLQTHYQQPYQSEHFDLGPLQVSLSTVDRFQGQEADLVLLSFVKSGRVGFLNSPNRLNVALTRAREELVLMGFATWFGSERCPSALLRTLVAKTKDQQGTGYPMEYALSPLKGET